MKTREEEIIEKANELANKWRMGLFDNITLVEDILIMMAQWADEHPKQKEEHQRGLSGNLIN